MCADGLQHEGVPFASSRRSGASLGSRAPATTRHRVTIQTGHRTTRTRTPPFKNAARTTTKHHIPIQNDHRAHTPSFKMQPAPQRNTTLRFKMATAPHAHARPASKCSPRHNGTPRYDRKWPPRHRETFNHNVVLAVSKKNIFFFCEHHVTIEHRATTRAQFCTITCSKCCACHEKTT